jgi:sulfotransferase family protein
VSGDPIFIVGPSRSGTSLIRHILNRHSKVWITGETHYFDDLRPRMRGREQSGLSNEEMSRCEDYFAGIAEAPYKVAARVAEEPFDRERLRQRATALGGGADGYFEAFCRLNAELELKERWGEKTPRHAFRMDEMLARYPRAKIIALARDPRAVVVSYRDLHARQHAEEKETFVGERERVKRSYHVLLATFLWRAAIRASLQARERHGRGSVRVQRFEDLVRSPEETLRDLCAWLELDYETTMLDVNVVSSSIRSDREIAGISPEPAERWRATLEPSEAVAIESAAGKLMDELGYEKEPRAGRRFQHVIGAWVTLPYGIVRAGLANRKRMGNIGSYLVRRLSLASRR